MYGRVGKCYNEKMNLLIKTWKSYKEFKVVKKAEKC
jgi:hypothetical protein